MQLLALLAATTLLAAPADLVIENAEVWTPGKTVFGALAAVTDGRFVYVGERVAGPPTHALPTRKSDASRRACVRTS